MSRRGAHDLAEAGELQADATDAPVIKLVYSVLAQAVGEGASDIHLEPSQSELRIRFRVDGVAEGGCARTETDDRCGYFAPQDYERARYR